MGHDFSVVLRPYSDEWRSGRRMIHQLFRPNAIPAYRPLQQARLVRMLKALLEEPTALVDLVKQYASCTPFWRFPFTH